MFIDTSPSKAMTIRHLHFAFCDVHENQADEDAATENYFSVEDLRAVMKAEGWKRKNGKDICPYCIATRKTETS